METDVGEKEIPSMFPDMITFHHEVNNFTSIRWTLKPCLIR